MRKNKKLTKDPIEKQGCENENAAYRRMIRWRRVVRVAICVFIAATVCLCGVLFELVRLQAQAQERLSGAEADRIRIYIDQGHNPAPYHNSGAEGNGLYEQDVTFRIGCLLAELLTTDGRFEVCLSRPYPDTVLGVDNASSLQARVDGAADFQADYFISIHINAYTQDTVNGAEALVFSGDGESYAFGRSLLDGVLDSTGLKNRGVKENSNLYVLKNATMPATLLELGFITNSGDAALLADRPELFAEGIYEGIVDYFASLYTSNIHILLVTIGVTACFAIAFAIAGRAMTKKCDLITREEKSDSLPNEMKEGRI